MDELEFLPSKPSPWELAVIDRLNRDREKFLEGLHATFRLPPSAFEGGGAAAAARILEEGLGRL